MLVSEAKTPLQLEQGDSGTHSAFLGLSVPTSDKGQRKPLAGSREKFLRAAPSGPKQAGFPFRFPVSSTEAPCDGVTARLPSSGRQALSEVPPLWALLAQTSVLTPWFGAFSAPRAP